MINALDLPLTEAVYTFVDGDTGEATHIAASTMLAVVKRAGVVPILGMFGAGLVEALERGDLGVEEAHAWSLPEAALEAPILVCQWGSEHVVADGAHRLWRRWKRGDSGFPMYYIPEQAWQPFIIDGLPGSGEFWSWFNRNAKVRT